MPSAAPTAEPRSGRWIAMLAATAVLISTAAVAVVLVGRYHPVAAHTPRADVPSLVATSATSAPIVPPAGQNQLAVGTAAATSPHAAAVVAPLSRYFDAVSHHSYGLYRRQFILALRGGLSAASFNAEFGATGPAAEQLQSITVIGGGTVEATVTVISRQLTAGPVSSACTAWIIEFYLGWRGYRYLLTAPPLWRQAAYHNCI